jgi:serine/threonine-protein kinase
MATVYVAHDLRHNRKVALKVLRPELAALIGAERFLKEIEVTANLQHPHILPLHDSGDADGFLFYVMPFVEGETLRDKLTRERQLGVDEAIALTKAVASALDYAHRHGVIHRDIKPENILLHDGQPVVADFGIALAVSHAGGTRLTETGLSVGTPHYMSPEQAMGDRELDARSDVYSLGAVLYEMLVGEPPFTGPTAQAIVAKVITERAPVVTVHRDTVPPHVAEAIQRALAKLPADRISSAAVFADALSRPGALAEQPRAAAVESVVPDAQRRFAWWHLAAAVALAAGVTATAMWLALRQPAAPGSVTRFHVAAGETTLRMTVAPALALSPDGSRLVIPGRDGLYLREMDQLEARLIPGTEGADQTAFSPDGEWIVYETTNDELRKVRLAGGGSIALAPDVMIGTSWGPDGTIVYSSDETRGLIRMTDAGADPQPITRPDTSSGETSHRWPDVLPEGRGVLFTIWKQGNEDAHIAVVSLKTGDVTDLGPGVFPRYLSSGHVAFGDGVGGALLVAPFDLDRLVLGDPVPVLEGVALTSIGGLHVAVSRSGGLAYLTGAVGERTLVRVDRRGSTEPLAAEDRDFREPRLSPDARRVAVRVNDDDRRDIWIYDLRGNTQTRLTVDGNNSDPAWTPDGSSVSFSSRRGGALGVFWRPWDGSAPAESLLTVTAASELHMGSWAPDGSRFTYRVNAGSRDLDLWWFDLSGDREARPYLATEFAEASPMISPDGSWLAYQSNESGRFEIYVRPFPDGGGRIPISNAGGIEPLWSRDGRELFYVDPDRRLVSVQVETSPAFRVGERTALFELEGFVRMVSPS